MFTTTLFMIQEPSIMMQISLTVTPHLAKILLKTTSCIELGSPPLYHHCGLDNVSKNNIIHRTSGEDSVDHLWAGCEKSHTGRLQSYSNYKNIYFLDNAEGLECGRRWDRFYDDAQIFTKTFTGASRLEMRPKQCFPIQ